MKKRILPIVFISCLVLLLISVTIYVMIDKKEDEPKDTPLNEKTSIVTYELQTHECCFTRKPEPSYYMIDSVEELNAFHKLYSDKIDISKSLLNKNTAFVYVEEVGSGSISMKLSSVSLKNNKVDFKITRNSPEVGTADMATWYLVAIIPNETIKEFNLDNWTKPSSKNKDEKEESKYEFELDSPNKYIVTTDMKWYTMQNDGGSHTNQYYQIDLDNNKVRKIQEAYKANLGGTPSTTYSLEYEKTIDSTNNNEIKNILDDILTKEDIKEDNNTFYSIETLNNSKNIYNLDTINQIKDLLNKIDNLS